MGNTILAKGVNHILAKRDNSAWPKGSKLSGFSINAGIDKMKDMEIYITKRSYNLQSEFRKYVWAKDKDGNYINEPEDHDNHGIDAVRYYVLGELLGKIQKPKDLTGIFTH